TPGSRGGVRLLAPGERCDDSAGRPRVARCPSPSSTEPVLGIASDFRGASARGGGPLPVRAQPGNLVGPTRAPAPADVSLPGSRTCDTVDTAAGGRCQLQHSKQLPSRHASQDRLQPRTAGGPGPSLPLLQTQGGDSGPQQLLWQSNLRPVVAGPADIFLFVA